MLVLFRKNILWHCCECGACIEKNTALEQTHEAFMQAMLYCLVFEWPYQSVMSVCHSHGHLLLPTNLR